MKHAAVAPRSHRGEPVETRRIGDVAVATCGRGAAIESVIDAVERGSQQVFGFANAHTVNLARTKSGVADLLSTMTLFNDGIGVTLASRLLYGRPFEENCNGTDLTSDLLAALPRPTRVFLLGGLPGVAEQARSVIHQRFPMAEVVGTAHGFFERGQGEELASRVRESGAELVLVAMGQPRQEEWAVRHAPACDAVMVCVGAYVDFVAGRIARAPAFIRAARLEWLYRMCREPRRLANRYLVGNATFLAATVRQRLARGPNQAAIRSH